MIHMRLNPLDITFNGIESGKYPFIVIDPSGEVGTISAEYNGVVQYPDTFTTERYTNVASHTILYFTGLTNGDTIRLDGIPIAKVEFIDGYWHVNQLGDYDDNCSK